MTLNEQLIAEIKMEAATTRKLLERVPVEKSDWKPHEKSMEIGKLAAHVAELPGWVTGTLTADEMDFAKREYKPFVPASSDELVAFFDAKVNEAIATLEKAPQEEFSKNWTLRHGDHIIFTMTKPAVIRSFALSHMYHHRGQLSVYLRLLDIPVPGTYGPTADEKN